MKRNLFVLGGTLLIVTLALNIITSLNQRELSDKSLTAFLNTAMAETETESVDGFTEYDVDCDIIEPNFMIKPGHLTLCVFSSPDLGCEPHDCE